MKSLTDQLANYANYHRDPRNVASHFVGIPMIVLAVQALLARWVWVSAPLPLGPAELLTALALLYYLRLDLALGALMALLLALGLWAAHALAALPQAQWLAWSLGLFVVGWVIQFVGHFWEGRKPVFMDDIMGLAIGPLFVVAEMVFALGGRPALHQAIINHAGPLRRRVAPSSAAS